MERVIVRRGSGWRRKEGESSLKINSSRGAMSVLHTLLVTAGIARNEEHRYPSQHRGTVGVKGCSLSPGIPVYSITVHVPCMQFGVFLQGAATSRHYLLNSGSVSHLPLQLAMQSL